MILLCVAQPYDAPAAKIDVAGTIPLLDGAHGHPPGLCSMTGEPFQNLLPSWARALVVHLVQLGALLIGWARQALPSVLPPCFVEQPGAYQALQIAPNE